MKTAIIYKLISGFTATYARWICEDVSADIYPLKDVSVNLLREYDLIVYGGSLHMVGISGYKRIKKYLRKLHRKSLIVFTTGASLRNDKNFQTVLDNNFTEDERLRIPFFYLRGGFDFDRLDFPNKILMTLLKWKLKITNNKTADMKGMLKAYSTPMDLTKKDRVVEIVQKIKSLEG